MKDDHRALGRRGEALLYNYFLENGYSAALDVAGGGNNRASLYNQKTGKNLIAPDALMVRDKMVLMEFKTKTSFFNWRGGNQSLRSQGNILPIGRAHGIDAHLLPHYTAVSHALKLPLILCILTIETGEVHCQSLKRLGQPFPSVDGVPMMNWPVARMNLMWRWDPDELIRYFYLLTKAQYASVIQQRLAGTPLRDIKELVGRVRPGPTIMPGLRDVRPVFDRLRPIQFEFASFLEDLIAHLERGWGS